MTAPVQHPPWFASLLSAGRTLLHGVGQLLFPNSCHVCGAVFPPDAGSFCFLCRNALLTDPCPNCPRCGKTVGPFVPLEKGCSRCREESLPYEAVLRLGPYEGIRQQIVLKMKTRSGEGLAELVGKLWAEHRSEALRQAGADVVVPIPLHWWKRWQRGHNQSEALALALAKALKVPCHSRWLRKIRHTPAQHHLSSTNAKRENVRGTFTARARGLAGKSILLVDDVMTTGSTVAEAARTLRHAGAKRIVVAVLARA